MASDRTIFNQGFHILFLKSRSTWPLKEKVVSVISIFLIASFLSKNKAAEFLEENTFTESNGFSEEKRETFFTENNETYPTSWISTAKESDSIFKEASRLEKL